MRSAWWVMVAALAAACTNLPVIPAGVCGNGVVENGEDCDSFPDPSLGANTACGKSTDGARACHYTCAAAACPTGWGCGADGTCRYANGQFADLSADFPAEIYGMSVGDVDGDELPDLVGYGNAVIWARFGTRDGRFPNEYDFGFDVGLSSITPSDMNGDALTDLVVPVPTGFVTLLGDMSRTFKSVTYSVFQAQAPGGIAVQPIRWQYGSPFSTFLQIVSDGPQLALVPFPVLGTMPPPPVFLPDPHTTADLTGLVHQNVDPDPLSPDEVFLAFQGDAKVFVYEVVSGPLDTMALRQEVPIPDTVFGPGLLVADVDGDGALDLIVPTTSGTVVAHGTGAGTFAAGTVDPRFDALPVPEAPSRMPLAAGDLDGDGRADYVGARGVWLDRGGTLVQTAWNVGAQPWTIAALADFNHDGHLDAAAAGSSKNVYFLLGSDTGFFSRSQVVTTGYPRILRGGDFDGDRIDDLAIVESSASDELSVVFGTTDGHPSTPVTMGQFGYVNQLEPTDLAVGPSTTDATNDLLVVQSADASTGATDVAISLFIGTSQHRMLSPFNIGVDPYTLVTGRFDPEPDATPDVLAFAGGHDFLIHGEGGGLFKPLDILLIPDGDLVTGFDQYCALWATGDLDGDGVDEVVGLDGDFYCNGGTKVPDPVRLSVSKLTGLNASPTMATTITPIDDFAGPYNVKLADLDGDQKPDLIVTYIGDYYGWLMNPSPSGRPDKSGVVVYWNQGGTFDAAHASAVPALPGATVLYDATSIAADTGSARELAIATDAGTWVVGFDPTTLAFTAPALPVVPIVSTLVLAADANADGLEDLIVYDGSVVHVWGAIPF